MNKTDFLVPLSLTNMIRLGPENDGGYVIYQRLLDETDILLTYGVGWCVDFEEHFNELTQQKVLMFDPTLFGKYMLNLNWVRDLLFRFRFKSLYGYLKFVWVAWRKRLRLAKKNIVLINEGISAQTFEKYDTLDSHLAKFRIGDRRILLKIDIEGMEFEVLESLDIFIDLKNVHQILVEFHNLKDQFDRFKKIIEKLKGEYEIIHIHGNNYDSSFYLNNSDGSSEDDGGIPNVLEVTFVRRSKIIKTDIIKQRRSYPIPNLDYPNDPSKSDLPLNFIYFKQH